MHSSKVLEAIDSVQFYGLSDLVPKDFPQNWTNSTVACAERLLQHRYSYLALGEINLGEEINWNREYKRGINTPLLFAPRMDYRDYESYGDFKYFWELPRLQHLITLAKAYYLTDEEKYAEEVIKQIKSFIKQSPYLLGVNWIMPMEASIRLISISWVTAFLKEYVKKNIQTCALIEQIVKSHVEYIARNYAAYSSANNHLVAEAAGVFVASTFFNEFEKMNTHQKKAYKILCKEITHQYYADGVNKEQAVKYQIFTHNCFLLAGLLGKENNIDFPKQYWDMLEKSANFVAAIAYDNCQLPEIGDSDDGRAFVLSETNNNYVQSILATSAVLFKRGDLKAKAGYFDEVSCWLMGKHSKNEFDILNENAVPNQITNKFEQGGYYILRGGSTTNAKLIFDCGPLGFETIAAHGHADSLSFTLNVYGLPYFIDPGTYTYIANNPFRNYFRSTAAHNTIVLDERNQSQIIGPFLWVHKADSYLDEWSSNENFERVTGRHNGYQRLRDSVIHRRAIEIDKEQEIVEIEDFLEAGASHEVTMYFHIAPQCQINKQKLNQLYIINNNKAIELVTDDKLDCSIITASADPIGGWASSNYDHKVPTNTIICRGTCNGNQIFKTKIRMAC